MDHATDVGTRIANALRDYDGRDHQILHHEMARWVNKIWCMTDDGQLFKITVELKEWNQWDGKP